MQIVHNNVIRFVLLALLSQGLLHVQLVCLDVQYALILLIAKNVIDMVKKIYLQVII